MSSPIAVSWGAGVQSTAIALLVEQGTLPSPDVWVFADTGDEPDDVYAHIEKWRERINLVTVRAAGPSLIENYLSAEGNPPQPPLWIDDPKTGRRMPMRRQCTERYKIRPIKAFLRRHFEIRPRQGVQVVQWLGISTDEAHRMKPAQAGWYDVAWPLIDLGMSRSDCLKLIADAGETAPRSACRYCPFHSNKEWARLQRNPREWAKVLAVEDAIRAKWERLGGLSGQNSCPTLHRDGPLRGIDFSRQQIMHWGNECEGMCGV